MRLVALGSREMVRVGASSSKEDQPLAGFEELAMPLFDALYNFARWLAHDSNDAEDLVQETYLKALRSFASFRPETNFRAWIFRILRNTFLTSCSRLDRRMTVAIDSEEDGPELAIDMENPETILMSRSDSQLMQRAIDDLPVHYRETLLLCEVEEMSYQEIAEILSIPMGTVMSRLARARKAVRESLLGAACGTQSRDFSFHIEAHSKEENLMAATSLAATLNAPISELQPATMDRILVIEGDDALRKVLRRLFSSEGYEVDVVPDGIAGLEMLRQKPPIAVILDIQRPESSECDLCGKIANLIPGLPLVILSASSKVADKVLLLEMGADQYVDHTVQPQGTCCSSARAHETCVARPSGRRVRLEDVIVDFFPRPR